MVTVSIESGSAVFEIQSLHRLLALRSRLEVPLNHITAVHTDPDLRLGFFDRFKLLGTYFPGFLGAGAFWEDGGLVFMDVKDPARAIVVELEDETYQRLVVEVADPDAVIEMLGARLTPWEPPPAPKAPA